MKQRRGTFVTLCALALSIVLSFASSEAIPRANFAAKKVMINNMEDLFYKTLNGARVGDLFMSIIHTAELAKINVFGYLVALQRHHERVAEDPAAWMPWNYSSALAQITGTEPPT